MIFLPEQGGNFTQKRAKFKSAKFTENPAVITGRVVTGNKVISCLCYVLSQTPLISQKYIQTEMEMKFLLNESF